MRALCLWIFYPSKSSLIYSIFSLSSSTLKLPAAKAAGIALAMHCRGSILDPLTGSHSLFRRVLQFPHLVHQVRAFRNERVSSSTGEDDLQGWGLSLQKLQGLLHRQEAVGNGHIDLIQDQKICAAFFHYGRSSGEALASQPPILVCRATGIYKPSPPKDSTVIGNPLWGHSPRQSRFCPSGTG